MAQKGLKMTQNGRVFYIKIEKISVSQYAVINVF